METTSARTDDKVAVTVTLTSGEVQVEIDAAYKKAGKNRIPGFRPGKAPRKVLENHFGGPEYFLATATDELVSAAAALALNEENLVPLRELEYGNIELAKEGENFSFGFTAEVAPLSTLSSYESVKIELPTTEATEEEVQEQVDSLLKYYQTIDDEGNEQLPELTDAWVKETLEFDNVDDFKERIKSSIAAQKEQEIPSLKAERSARELAKRLEGELPEPLVQQIMQGNYRDLFYSLQNQGITLDFYLQFTQQDPQQFNETMRRQAEEATAVALALDAVARQQGLSVTEDEVREEFTKSGVENVDKLYEDWRKGGRLPEIREGLLRMKARAYLDEHIEVFAVGELYPVEEEAGAKKGSAGAKAAQDKPQAKAKAGKAKASAKATPEPAPQTGAKTDAKAASKTAAKTEAKAAVKPRAKTEPKTDAKTAAKTSSKAGPKAK